MNRYASSAVTLAEILARMIAARFPELRRFRIAIDYEDLADTGELLYYAFEDGRYRIAVSGELRGAPRAVLEGGLAHELCHILRDSRWGPLQRELAYEKYDRSALVQARDERATELEALKRGYGRELLAFIRHMGARGYAFRRAHGLNRAEIGRWLVRNSPAASRAAQYR